ncbi:MAG: alanine racemase [bacterium]
MTSLLRPTIAEISLEAIKDNIRQVKGLVGPKVKVMPIIKSNAYGHGAIPVARAVEPEIDFFGVAFVYEGIELRRAGIRCPIVIMGGVLDGCLEPALEHNLVLAVGDFTMASSVSRSAQKKGIRAKIHVEVDTGMGRLGIPCDGAVQEIRRMCELTNIEVEGVFSHLATSEVKQDDYTLMQLKRFRRLLGELEERGIHIPIKHLANSAAILQYPETWFDMVRPGLMIYGIYPSEHLQGTISLQFPLTVKTRIIQIRSFCRGESISYGRTFICPGHRRIAVIPVGYADGFSRILSNRVEVLVRDKMAPVVGTICMDMCMIDITHIPEAGAGDEVILVGGETGRQMVERMASLMGTIPYEILSSFGRRVRRIYAGENHSDSTSRPRH